MSGTKYSKGDKIVHPMYGAGVVDDVEEKLIDGESKPYYVLKIPFNDLTVSVSAVSAKVNLRPINEKTKLKDIIAKAELQPINPTENWNVVYKNNLTKVKSGNIEQVASVFKYLTYKERGKTLSTIEKKMMGSAKQIITSEIMLAYGLKKAEAETMLKNLVG